jgi:hypothetical protein
LARSCHGSSSGTGRRGFLTELTPQQQDAYVERLFDDESRTVPPVSGRPTWWFAHGEDRVTSSATASRVADAVAVDGAGATFHAFQPVVISFFAERCNPSSYYRVR